MPVFLGDYLGQIMAELTRARVQADVEAVRIAELYAEHDLLRHFPVPRIRFHDTQLDVPVAVIGAGVVESPQAPPAPATKFGPLWNAQADKLGLSAEARARIDGALQTTYDKLTEQPALALDPRQVAGRLSDAVRKELEQVPGVEAVDKARALADLQREASRELRGSGPPRVEIGVSSLELRDAPPESIVRLSIKVSEEAMEWSVLDQDSGRQVLSPE